MRKTLKTNLCEINYSDSLEDLVQATIPLLNKKVVEYNTFFNVSNKERIVVNYFDTIEEFREFIFRIRGERESLPKYAEGTYDKGMVNAYINPEIQLKKLYMASHELFHIMYMKYILNNDYSKRIVWYDEGMAQLMSGETDLLRNSKEFKDFYMKVKESTKVIPKMNVLEHGDSFVNQNYNGYDLSFLAIKYISEVLSPEQFKCLMSDFEKINKLGDDIIQQMFKYYDEELKETIIKSI